MSLLRPNVEYCSQPQGPQHKTDMDLLEQVHMKAMRIIMGLEHRSL